MPWTSKTQSVIIVYVHCRWETCARAWDLPIRYVAKACRSMSRLAPGNLKYLRILQQRLFEKRVEAQRAVPIMQSKGGTQTRSG